MRQHLRGENNKNVPAGLGNRIRKPRHPLLSRKSYGLAEGRRKDKQREGILIAGHAVIVRPLASDTPSCQGRRIDYCGRDTGRDGNLRDDKNAFTHVSVCLVQPTTTTTALEKPATHELVWAHTLVALSMRK